MLRVLARLECGGSGDDCSTLLAAHTVPPEFADRREEYVRWIADELIPEVAAAGLARYCDAFCDDHAFTVEETRTVLMAARQPRHAAAGSCRAVPAGNGSGAGRGTGRGDSGPSGDGDR